MSLYKNKSKNNYIMNDNICENCIKLKNDIDILYVKIECIECDNEELKIEVKELKKENQEFKKRIIFLENENQELKKENQELKKENLGLKKRIDILEFDKIKNKIITALQDLNSHDKLEIILSQPFNSCFVNIRNNRNYNNHYIDINDSNNLIENKKKYLLLQLLELNEENITILNKRFCKRNTYYCIIEEVIKYLQNNTKMNIEIDDDNLQTIEFWWDD